MVDRGGGGGVDGLESRKGNVMLPVDKKRGGGGGVVDGEEGERSLTGHIM